VSQERVPRAVQGGSTGAVWKGLRVLALHNCSHVSRGLSPQAGELLAYQDLQASLFLEVECASLASFR